jgi:putative endopeptidase
MRSKRSISPPNAKSAIIGIVPMKSSKLILPLSLTAIAFARYGLSLDTSSIDKSVSPTADFFEYANGAWLSKSDIPPEKAAIGVSDELRDRNDVVLKEVAESAAATVKSAAKSPREKVGLFYKVGMDEERAEKLGAVPIQAQLLEIDNIKNAEDVAAEIARLQKIGVSAGFRASAGQDEKNSSEVIFGLRQGGLGLPTADSYLNDSDRAVALRKRYAETLAKGFELTGESPEMSETDAKDVIDLETRLAKASSTPLELRDTNANYHRTDLAGVKAMGPGFAWDPYFATLGKADPGPVNVGQPKFFAAFGDAVRDVPLPTWKAYLRHQVIADASPFLSKDFVENQFKLASSFRGVSAQQSRWKRVLASTNSALGEALGELYVEKTFTPEAKIRAYALVQNLKAVLRDRIMHLDWMEEATKQAAVVKLDAMRIKVGYPDKWRDYSKLVVKDDSYIQNIFRAREFSFQRNMNKLGKPVDRNEWGMTPPTVNAYYSPSMNEIVFPAGILQSPFFDPSAPDAANYGSIGAVIGHEMTHGFDDEGRQFDGKGNLRDWWTASDAKNFAERTEALAKQYDNYVVVDDVHLNGHLTLGENIADLGGVKIAYLAYKRATEGKPQPIIDGYTPDQQFFLAYGQSWREKRRPQAYRLLAASDPHSAERFRVNGVVQNTPEFWKAWGVEPPANTIRIW